MFFLFFRLLSSFIFSLWLTPSFASVDFTNPWKERIELEGEEPQQIILADKSNWKKVTRNKVPDGFNQVVWIKNQLPQNIKKGQALYFVNGLEDIQVFIEGKLVYSHGRFDRDWLKMTSQHWHLIPLKPEWSSKTVFVRLH